MASSAAPRGSAARTDGPGSSARRYVVTGSAGFIGSHLADALVAGGHDVVGVDAFTPYYARAIKETNLASPAASDRFTFVEADLTARELDDLFAGADGLFHLAAQPGVRSSWGSTFGHYVRHNLLATQRVFEQAVRSGVRVVFASSSSVYGDAESYPTPEDATCRPVSPYGITKHACERMADVYAPLGLDVVSLRYFTVYGPRQRPDMAFSRIVSALLGGEPFEIFGTGEQSRDFTFVADAVAATIAAMEHGRPGAVYNVGGGTEASLNEAIALCERIAGIELRVTRRHRAAGDIVRTSADTTLIRGELGWSPRTSLEDGLTAQIRSSPAQSTAGDGAVRAASRTGRP